MFALKKYVVAFVLVLAGIAAAHYVMSDHSKVKKYKKIVDIMFKAPKEHVKKIELENGMHVVLFKNTALPKVLVQIAYDVGSYVEESGERGLAHLVEHMIFKGTDTLSESDVTAIARKYGATYNAFTSYDMTSYFFEVDKNNWHPFLPILADCMQNARFDPQHLASEVKAVIQELKMYKDSPTRVMLYKALELLYPPHHPYHTPVIGYKEDLLSLSAERVKAFYKKYYRPDRATLFIVGDIDLDEAESLARKNFGAIKASPTSVKKDFPVVLPDLTTHHTRFYEEITSPMLALYWLIPGYSDEQEQVGSVINAILAGGQAGRLVRLLVDEHKVAASVGISEVTLMHSGVFFVLVRPLPGKTEECVSLVSKELEKIARDGVTDEELARTIKTKSKDFFHSMHDYSTLVYDWIQSYFVTRNELDVFEKVNRFSAITDEQVKDFARVYLDPILMHRMDMLPIPEDKKRMRQDAKMQSDRLDQEILAKHVRNTDVEEAEYLHKTPAQDRLEISFPKPDRQLELENGLRVLIHEQHHTPLVSVFLGFRDGYYLDSSREGIQAQVMMDMLIEGSKGRTKIQNVDLFERNGASYEFTTSGVTFTCLKQDFSDLLEHMFLIVCQPTFPHDALEKLKKMTLEAIKKQQDSPKAIASRILRSAIYKGYPFEWSYDDAAKDIQALNESKLRQLHNQLICGKNMTLTIVGDVEVDQAARLAQQKGLALGAGERFAVPTFKSQSGEPVVLKHNMLRDQTIVILGRPSPVTVFHPDNTGLRVLSTIAFDSLGSRIFELRERSGLFYTASGAFASSASVIPGFDQISAIISPENVDTFKKGIKEMLEVLGRDGVQQTELNAARTSFTKDLIDVISDTTAIARTLCKLDSYNLGFDYYDKMLQALQDMTIDDLNALAKRYSTIDDMTTVIVGRVD